MRESELESMNETEKSVAKVKKVQINRLESLLTRFNGVQKTVQATFEVRVRMKYECDDYN